VGCFTVRARLPSGEVVHQVVANLKSADRVAARYQAEGAVVRILPGKHVGD